MSIFSSFTKKSKLDESIKLTGKARKSQGAQADHLFDSACRGYAEVIQDDPLRAAALYHWGFALLTRAKTKSGDEAVRLYEEAIAKFTFCSLIQPGYLAAAIDCGVAHMDLARLKEADISAEPYQLAKRQFEKANAIQAGSASYNLACLRWLARDHKACLQALEQSYDKGSLPDEQDILNDPDLAGIQHQDWFHDFMASVKAKSQTAAEKNASAPTPSADKAGESP